MKQRHNTLYSGAALAVAVAGLAPACDTGEHCASHRAVSPIYKPEDTRGVDDHNQSTWKYAALARIAIPPRLAPGTKLQVGYLVDPIDLKHPSPHAAVSTEWHDSQEMDIPTGQHDVTIINGVGHEPVEFSTRWTNPDGAGICIAMPQVHYSGLLSLQAAKATPGALNPNYP